MSHYVCAYVPGGSCFFTVALLECHRRLLTEHVAALRAAFVSVRRQRPFHLDAIVVLPDHLHCLWTLPPDDADYSTRWRSLEASFARTLAPGERLSDRRQQKGERGIWQRRFWEHAIRDQRDFNIHCDYIHYNRSNMALWRGWPNRWPVADAGRTRSASANRVVCGNRPSRTILRDGLSHKEGEMIDELDCVVLTTDIPEHGLAAGDIGTVVMVHEAGRGFEVEFVALDGETLAVASLAAAQIRPVAHREIAHARPVAA